MTRTLIIGSSHALHLASAVGSLSADLETASRQLVPIATAGGGEARLLFATNRPSFLELAEGPNGQVTPRFGPLMDELRAFDRPDAKVVLNIGGNEHNIRFLCAHPTPFDFEHPAVRGLLPGRQVIPAREMAAILRGLLGRTLTVTRVIAAELPAAQRFYLPPPPPVASEAQIRTNPAIFDFDAHGIEDAGVRLKIYSLYLEIAQAFCAAHQIRFIPPVAAHRDEAGFLRAPFWEGSTHANPDYYRPIVAELGL